MLCMLKVDGLRSSALHPHCLQILKIIISLDFFLLFL